MLNFGSEPKKDRKIASIVHIICMNKICNDHDQIAAEISSLAPSKIILSFFEIRTFFLKHPVDVTEAEVEVLPSGPRK